MDMLSPRIQPQPPAGFTPFEKSEIYQGIHERFEKQVKRFPNRLAVKDPERSFTYLQLNRAANNLARQILARNASGQVAFTLENNAFSIVALLAILKAGRAYVPLDPSFPKDRTAYMFRHAQAGMIISDKLNKEVAHEISGGNAPLLLLEDVDLEKDCDDLGIKVDPMSLAYILFTSGSTGQPKGIAFCHRNLLHTKMCLTNALRVSPEDRLTQLHSTSFAAAVVDIYASLLNGASVFSWDVKTRGTTELASWLMKEEVTSIQWIPTPFRQLVDTVEKGQRFESVRLVVMASEPLTRREFDLFKNRFSERCLLVNQIGTSESYNYYLFFADHATVFEGSSVPAGYPVSDDREVLLWDDNRKPVGNDQVGEIAIRSEYMSLGYWRNEELTKKVFVPDPDGSGKKVYLTGDLGRRLKDGCLIHMGRKDFQVKIRGYRVELPEVELAMKKVAGVQDVAVMPRTDQTGELKLVGYYVTGDSQPISITRLRRSLDGQLPDYMVPNYFVHMVEFPMTATGKLDRNALPAPVAGRPALDTQYVAPQTETEEIILGFWRDILGQAEIGTSDNFFELGGDSLQAAQILHLIHMRFGVDLGYTALLRAPSVATLSMLLDQPRVDGTAILPPPQGTRKVKRSGLGRALLNRVVQVLALYAPGLKTWRPKLHRLRGVRIGRNVAIGTAAIIETEYPELVSIGDNVAIGIRNVILGHFSNSIDGNRKPGEPTVRICNNVYIGPNVTILPNVTIGEGSVIAAGSVVNKSVAPNTMVQGNPARVIAKCGVPLMGNSYEKFLRHLEPVTSESNAHSLK